MYDSPASLLLALDVVFCLASVEMSTNFPRRSTTIRCRRCYWPIIMLMFASEVPLQHVAFARWCMLCSRGVHSLCMPRSRAVHVISCWSSVYGSNLDPSLDCLGRTPGWRIIFVVVRGCATFYCSKKKISTDLGFLCLKTAARNNEFDDVDY